MIKLSYSEVLLAMIELKIEANSPIVVLKLDPEHTPDKHWMLKHELQNGHFAEYGCGAPANAPDYSFGVAWCTGGMSGGSCWEDSNLQPFSTDHRAPEFKSLQQLLEKIVPDLSAKNYNRLCNEVIHHDECSDSGDYYGNHDNYSNKWVSPREIYEWLVDEGVVEGSPIEAEDSRDIARRLTRQWENEGRSATRQHYGW